MGSFSPKISIIIVHLDNQLALVECLKSCQKILYPNYEIIIVKNGSKSQLSLTALQGFAERVSMIINSTENVGYARGNNLGIRKALTYNANYILLLNDDTIVSPNFLDILVEEGEKSSNIGMLGPTIYYAGETNRIWFSGAYFNRQTCMILTPGSNQFDKGRNGKPFDSDYITGCAVLVKRQVIEKIGMLDKRFFLYWEDVDWGLRAKKAGFANWVIPNAHIWHKVSVSTGGMESPLRAYHKTRSHLAMAKLHAPWALNRLHWGFSRDVAWLLFKSTDLERVKKARAYISAIKDYHLGRTNKGPLWLWSRN
jgi:GT2 family glycosyltransferase